MLKKKREKQREKEAASGRGEKVRVRQLEPEKCVGGIKRRERGRAMSI